MGNTARRTVRNTHQQQQQQMTTTTTKDGGAHGISRGNKEFRCQEGEKSIEKTIFRIFLLIITLKSCFRLLPCYHFEFL